MPWDIRSDRKRFLTVTRDHPIIMGRKTFESIGRPLPNRKNIVLTRQSSYHAEGCVVTHDLHSALAIVTDTEEVFICGGGEVFLETIFFSDRIYLTIVHVNIGGDTFFPEIPSFFVEVRRSEMEDVIPHDVVLYVRKGRSAGSIKF